MNKLDILDMAAKVIEENIAALEELKRLDKINIYLAAKMTGVDDYNYPAIIAEAIKLKIMTGCHIVHTANAPRGWKYEDYIKHSLEMLRHCDAVYLLPGWEGSEGVERELAEAFRLGKPVFEWIGDLQAWIGGNR